MKGLDIMKNIDEQKKDEHKKQTRWLIERRAILESVIVSISFISPYLHDNMYYLHCVNSVHNAIIYDRERNDTIFILVY